MLFTSIALIAVPAAMAGVQAAMAYTETREEEIQQSLILLDRVAVGMEAKISAPKEISAEKYTWLEEPEFGGPVLLTDTEFSWWVREGHLNPDRGIIAGILRKQPARLKEEGCSVP